MKKRLALVGMPNQRNLDSLQALIEGKDQRYKGGLIIPISNPTIGSSKVYFEKRPGFEESDQPANGCAGSAIFYSRSTGKSITAFCDTDVYISDGSTTTSAGEVKEDPTEDPNLNWGFTGADIGASGGLSNGNRTFTSSVDSSAFANAWRRYTSAHTGRRKYEFEFTTSPGRNLYVGVISQDVWISAQSRYEANPHGASAGTYMIVKGGFGGIVTGLVTDGSNTSDNTYDFTTNVNITVYVDYDDLKVWFGFDGTPVSGNPDAGSGQTFTLPHARFDPMITTYEDFETFEGTANFKQSHWEYGSTTYGQYEDI